MSSAWSQLEQMLTCAICLDKFKNPRLLPCQHSFCGDACMDGLVDYARRQIKCPECRAEHRIPYQGVQSLPANVTLTRFLELHSRITGEEPEPVPTFMEKCSVCGEKVEGVQRCAHCDKKVCPECKEAHLEMLRREVVRINGQAKRCLSKMVEFRETLDRSEERLRASRIAIRREIEEAAQRLVEELAAKQRKLVDEAEAFAEQEQRTIEKLRAALKDELEVLESNWRLADEKLTNKFQWTDHELSEMKEVYARALEFARLFEPEIGDYTRKMRFTLIPDFEALRRRLCELGELRFGESAHSLMAAALQHCGAAGQVAGELCGAAAASAAASAAGFGLAHSSSNSNVGANMLELPGMQNALMRSQSDHRLASQFQQRLKQQQEASSKAAGTGSGRYGASSGAAAARDYETDALRSRYAPPRSAAASKSDYASDLLTRDWPRPTDSDPLDSAFGSSIHFKSAFMRRKEKERQQVGAYASNLNNDDDDDLNSEASYGAHSSARNVRFSDPSQAAADQSSRAAAKLFDCKQLEHAPLSGVPKLADSPHLLSRLHQMGAKSIVDRKRAEEEGKRDKELLESARQAVSKASERKSNNHRQLSEDEIERQKRVNKQSPPEAEAPHTSAGDQESSSYLARAPEPVAESPPRHSPTPTADLLSSASTVVEAEPQPATPPSPAVSGGRRGLYGQAVTEKSKRQLSDAIQSAANYSRRRAAGASSSSIEQAGEPEAAAASSAAGSAARAKRTLRSNRSLSKQSSLEQETAGSPAATTAQRRRRNLTRAESSQQSVESAAAGESGPKNSPTGSGGHSDNSQSSHLESSLAAGQQVRHSASSAQQRQSAFYDRQPVAARTGAPQADQTSTTTDEDGDNPADSEARTSRLGRDTPTPVDTNTRSRSARSSGSEPEEDAADKSDDSNGYNDERNANHRASRELLPNAVNKLLDRSAQIRRDSQEQRSRGDSPQRTPARSYYSTGSSARTTTGYSSSPTSSTAGMSAATRQRLAYQRSQSIRDSQHADDDTTNSNNSIYTTASSGSNLAGSGRKSSLEDELASSYTARRLSGNSTDRTLTSTERARPTYRRDSSGDSAPAYQSRFLARSRTSATLSSASSTNRSQDIADNDSNSNDTPARSYLSSRDRFMQSAGVASAGSSNSPSGSSNLYSRTGSSPAPPTPYPISSLGQNRHHPSSQAYYSDNSPFIEFDDEDDEYSAYFPSGVKTQSEYLRNKFRRTSSNSSTSSALLRSRSSHAAFANRDSNEDDDEDNSNDEEESEASHLGLRNGSYGSRRGSLANASFDSTSSGALKTAYSSKRRMLFKLGSRGSDPGNFTWPRGVAVGLGSRGREIVVADSSNHRVQIFDSKGKFLNEFGSYGSAQGEFDCLAGVAINRVNKNYVVSDRYNHRIQVFDMAGNFVRAFGEMGREPGKFNLPWGVACDTSGLIYVCDKENHRIQVFDVDGVHLNKFGVCGNLAGQLQHPHYIAVGSGKVVVTDTNNHRVQVFDLSGRIINSFGREGSSNGQFKFPRGVAMDDQGYIIVGDSGNNRMQIFNSEGIFVKCIGTWGSADGEFKGIEGVAVDTNYNILVCDRENHRIQVF